MFAAALAAAFLAAATGTSAPLDAAACEAIPGAPDEGPRFEDPDGVFAMNLPSSWVQKERGTLGMSEAEATAHGSRAAFDLRQGDIHRMLNARVVQPIGTREQDVGRLNGGLAFGLGKTVTLQGAPCIWAQSQGKGHAREQSLVCDVKVQGTPARFVIDLVYLDTDTCNHGLELQSIVRSLKWGAGVTPGAK